MHPVEIALGSSDFIDIRRQASAYVDKTAAIAGLLEREVSVSVFCRPRRFGKSLFLSTLAAFVERQPIDRSPLFEGLTIWGSTAARAHFQRHPVIHISLKGMRGATFPEALEGLCQVIGRECYRIRQLWPELPAEGGELFRGVVTGVLRVSREGLWSSFNNTVTYSVLDGHYADAFGFTETEVEDLRTTTGSSLSLDELRIWYNGYSFGGRTIYNPWSVLHALYSGELRPWWVETASHEALGRLLRKGGASLQEKLVPWMAGSSTLELVGDTVLLAEERPDDVVPLLLHGGYLTIVEMQPQALGWRAELRVPNQDVLAALGAASRRWLREMDVGYSEVEELGLALLAGSPRFGEQLGRQLLGASSAQDFPFPDAERGYHTFLLGLLCALRPRWQVISNVESGLGRADILVVPTERGQPGAVIEMGRVATPEDGPAALEAALTQVGARRYDTRLVEAGANPVRAWGIAFCSKEQWSAQAPEPALR